MLQEGRKQALLQSTVLACPFIHGVNGYLPHLCVLLWVIREGEIGVILFERSDERLGSHHDKPLNHEKLVVVLNYWIKDSTVI